jgi:hypothetical protein
MNSTTEQRINIRKGAGIPTQNDILRPMIVMPRVSEGSQAQRRYRWLPAKNPDAIAAPLPAGLVDPKIRRILYRRPAAPV